ncbi:MAG: hypothetical protein RL385_970 [Pseudomonadota bacterium]
MLLYVLAPCIVAIPCPRAWLDLLAPNVVQEVDATRFAVGLAEASWIPLSLDPASSHERIAYGVAVGAAFLSARLLVGATGGTGLLRFVAVSSVGVAAAHLGHSLLHPHAVFGLYVPSAGAATGPLLNPNNLAGYMALGVPLCMGLGLRAGRLERWVWWFLAGVVAATGLLAGSRAGAAAILFGPLAFATIRAVRRRRTNTRTSTLAAARGPGLATRATVSFAEAAALVVMVGAIGYGLAELAGDDFVDTNYRDLSKLDLLRAEATALWSSSRTFWFGVGRGGFWSWFAGHYTGPGRVLFAECLPLQHAVELGVPLTLACGVLLILRLKASFWRLHSDVHLGAFVGWLALFLQNFVDYSLELTGIAVSAAVCLAAALPPARFESVGAARNWRESPAISSKLAWTFTGISFLALATTGHSAWRFDALRLERRLSSQLGGPEPASTWQALQRACAAHPADPTFLTLASAHAVLTGSTRAQPLLNRALALAPGWSGPHLWAAYWFLVHERPVQANVELALASETAPREAIETLCSWLKRSPDARLVLDVAPAGGEARKVVLAEAARCLAHAPAEAEVVDDALLAISPADQDALARRARRQLEAGNPENAIALAQELQRIAPRRLAAYSIESDALHKLGRGMEALQVLLRGEPQVDDRRGLLMSLAWTYTALSNAEGMRSTVDQLRLHAGGHPTYLIASASLLGQCEAALGNDARALKALREAISLGAGDEVLALFANVAVRLGQVDIARDAYGQLCGAAPERASFCQARDSLNRRLNGL